MQASEPTLSERAAAKATGKPFLKALLMLVILGLIVIGYWYAGGEIP